MAASILDSVKKVLLIDSGYTDYDDQIILFINGAFSELNQLGVGPAEGFEIENATATWDNYISGDSRYNSVKTYIYLKVRMLFDPPTTSFLIEAMNKQLAELAFRINVLRESTFWEEPVMPSLGDEDYLIDGGNP